MSKKMTIKQIEVTVGEITKGYVNNDEQGVRGYDGLLDIRPPYQREFIYNEREQQAVITTVLNDYPLNVMYWVRRADDADCPYEVMDGQQRTLSLCEYVCGKFAYEFKNFFNQPEDIRRRILDYPLTVYVSMFSGNFGTKKPDSCHHHAADRDLRAKKPGQAAQHVPRPRF